MSIAMLSQFWKGCPTHFQLYYNRVGRTKNNDLQFLKWIPQLQNLGFQCQTACKIPSKFPSQAGKLMFGNWVTVGLMKSRGSRAIWMKLETCPDWRDNDLSIRGADFEFRRFSGTRVMYDRWYRSEMFLGMLLDDFGGASTSVVVRRASNRAGSKCWRN